jgi:hypothetical protein
MSYSDIAAQSQMLVFHVDLETGIVPVGAVDGSFLVAAPPSQNDPYTYCYPTGDPSGMFQRGVFMDNVLFAVAPGGIAAVESEDPATTLGQVQFGTQAMPWSCWTDTVLVEPIEGVGGTSGVAGGVAVGGSAGEVAEGGSVTVGVVSSSGGSTGVGGTTGVAASE